MRQENLHQSGWLAAGSDGVGVKLRGARDRDRRLRAAGYRSYAAYLRSEHWRAFKARYRRSRETLKACFVCGGTPYDLHHRVYARCPGKERLSDVIPLCRGHHQQLHRLAVERFRTGVSKGRRDGLAILALELRRAFAADDEPGLKYQERPPEQLRGKALGHWYRDRYRLALSAIHPDLRGTGRLSER